MSVFFKVLGILGSIGAATAVVKLAGDYADNTKKKGCRIPTNQAIFQANQAFQSGNPAFIQAVMTIFDNYGCHAEAQAMRDYLSQHGYPPNVSIIPAHVPQAGPGEVLLQPGETWRGAAILGGIGCAVGLDTLKQKIEEKGFASVNVYSKNPGWGKDWDADPGFLECTRYVQGMVKGNSRTMKKPSQVYKLERVSVAT